MNFLSATWENLLFANYSIDPGVLDPYVPAGTRIDTIEGHVFVSLVAFMFNNTRVMGIPLPFHQTFEEVNLRFYVTPNHDETIRAVTFIKEVVPKSAVTFVANTLFREHYQTLPMTHSASANVYRYTWGKDEQHAISATVESEPVIPTAGSIGEFITEHYWGYSKAGENTREYRVEHPQWPFSELSEYQIDVDFGDAYGPEFSFLNDTKPHSVLFANGSAVQTSFPSRMR